MTRTLFSTFAILLFIIPSFSQNLVPNPSFEKVNKISSRWMGNASIFERTMETWTSPNQGSPDILFEKTLDKMIPPRKGVDLSPHRPRTGKFMVGIKTYGCASNTMHCKEYLQIELKESLNPDTEYFIEFWVNPMSTSIFCNNMGMVFSDTEIDEMSIFGIHYFDPVVNETAIIAKAPNNWYRIAATVIPDRVYSHILIGNFITDDETKASSSNAKIKYSYYLIDDVTVRPLNGPEEKTLADLDLEIGNNIALNNILFETAKADLLPESFEELDQLVEILQTQPKMTIKVNGHTDNQGEIDYNFELSKNRALAVVKYLSQKGISRERLQYEGFGESQPIASNKSPEGQQLNRRVEFLILSK